MHLGDILDIINERSDSTLSLNDAMSMARDIMELHSTGLKAKEQEGFDKGYKEGKADTEYRLNFELDRLRRVNNTAKVNAEELVKEVVRTIGSHKKIQCIKELRNRTGLGLRDTKDIVDAYCLKLDRMELMDYQRANYDAAYSAF